MSNADADREAGQEITRLSAVSHRRAGAFEAAVRGGGDRGAPAARCRGGPAAQRAGPRGRRARARGGGPVGRGRCGRGETVGPLAGVPFVVKDNIDVHGQVTASGSRAHPGVVALADAPVVRRLRRQERSWSDGRTWTSWQWVPRPRPPPTVLLATRWTAVAARAGAPVVVPPRSPRDSRRSRWGPTPAGRSANRPRSAGSSGWRPPPGWSHSTG